MKSYNIQNYIRWKEDIEYKIFKLPKIVDGDYTIWNREQMIIGFAPLVENLARKFSTSQQASGVMDITDLIQEGNSGLIKAVDRLDYLMLKESEDQEKTLKSFLSKRIKGAIRRGIDINRGNIRIPEHKLNEIRKEFGTDKKVVEMFFNSVFTSLDDDSVDENKLAYNVEDDSGYNKNMLNAYILTLLKYHLTDKEYDVIRMSYGLDCEKHTATEIASKLGIAGSSSYVRISMLKKQAIQKLIDNVDASQVIDFL